MSAVDTITLEQGEAIRAQSATLRELHALLKAKDPGFGGLARVMNKRQEFLSRPNRLRKSFGRLPDHDELRKTSEVSATQYKAPRSFTTLRSYRFDSIKSFPSVYSHTLHRTHEVPVAEWECGASVVSFVVEIFLPKTGEPQFRSAIGRK